MSGIYGTSIEDSHFENELNEYLEEDQEEEYSYLEELEYKERENDE